MSHINFEVSLVNFCFNLLLISILILVNIVDVIVSNFFVKLQLHENFMCGI